MKPTPEELAYVESRSMSDTFAAWTDDQRSVYLAVYRAGRPTARVVASHLGWTNTRTAEVLDSVYGYLLWDKSKPDDTINLRD